MRLRWQRQLAPDEKMELRLTHEREVALPVTLAINSELRGRFLRAMEESPERRREGQDELNGIENSLKVFIGRTKALNDPVFTGKLAAAETELKAKSAGNAAIGDPWAQVEGAMTARRKLYLANRFIRPNGSLYGWALTLVRGAAEKAKPNGERLPGYTDSALPLTEKRLLDARPVTPWVDELYMSWSLSKAREYLGADDADTRLLLGRGPDECRAWMVRTERYKYVHWQGYPPQLFDLANDPHEIDDRGRDPGLDAASYRF